MQRTTRFFPFLRYEDAPAAFEWLHRAFGFEKQMLVPGPRGTVAHAQLRYGASVLMIGTADDDFMNMKSPKAAGGVTQGIYVHVDDIDAHHDRAKAAGAEIVMALEDTQYGSREYAARDPEGHLWSFGTYGPETGDTRGPETSGSADGGRAEDGAVNSADSGRAEDGAGDSADTGRAEDGAGDSADTGRADDGAVNSADSGRADDGAVNSAGGGRADDGTGSSAGQGAVR